MTAKSRGAAHEDDLYQAHREVMAACKALDTTRERLSAVENATDDAGLARTVELLNEQCGGVQDVLNGVAELLWEEYR